MNNGKYIAALHDYTITQDNCINGENPEQTWYEEPPVKRIRFNNIGELKDELCKRFDENNFIICHNEDNRYDVLWTTSDNGGMIAPSTWEWEEYHNGKRDLYSCLMHIDIYSIAPVNPADLADQID